MERKGIHHVLVLNANVEQCGIIMGYCAGSKKQQTVQRQHTAFVKEVKRWYETHPDKITFAVVAAF